MEKSPKRKQIIGKIGFTLTGIAWAEVIIGQQLCL